MFTSLYRSTVISVLFFFFSFSFSFLFLFREDSTHDINNLLFMRVDREVFHIFLETSHFKSLRGLVWKKLWILDYQLSIEGSLLSGSVSNLQKLCNSSTEDCSINKLLLHFIEFIFLEHVQIYLVCVC